MVRNDLEACLQAYQFAELLLGGFLHKDDKEREQALQAALGLRDSVEQKYQALLNRAASPDDALQALKATKARLEQKLDDAAAVETRWPRDATRP